MAQAARWQPRHQQTRGRHAWRSGRRALSLLAAAITIGWSAFATGTGPASASQTARSQLTASSRPGRGPAGRGLRRCGLGRLHARAARAGAAPGDGSGREDDVEPGTHADAWRFPGFHPGRRGVVRAAV